MAQSHRNPASRPHIEPILLRPEDAGATLGVGPDFIRKLADLGEIETVHLGTALRVVPESLLAYRERLRAAEAKPKPQAAASKRIQRQPAGDVILLRS